MFQILVYYKDEDALQKYIQPFFRSDNLIRVKRDNNMSIYEGQHTLITCIQNLTQNNCSIKASIIAVQEELTWNESWPETKHYFIEHSLISPIDIQIFDGVIKEEVTQNEYNDEV